MLNIQIQLQIPGDPNATYSHEQAPTPITTITDRNTVNAVVALIAALDSAEASREAETERADAITSRLSGLLDKVRAARAGNVTAEPVEDDAVTIPDDSGAV